MRRLSKNEDAFSSVYFIIKSVDLYADSLLTNQGGKIKWVTINKIRIGIIGAGNIGVFMRAEFSKLADESGNYSDYGSPIFR